MKGTIQSTASIGGISIASTLSREAEGHIAHDPTLAAGKAGELTTRTDDNTGVATMSTGHGIQTGNVVDVYWADGVRYGMECTVSGNLVTIDGGAGDVLPVATTAVVLSVITAIDVDFSGDELKMISVMLPKRGHIDIRSSGGSIKAVELTANEAWQWADDTDLANPLAGQAVAEVRASCGDSSAGGTLKVGILYDSVE
jgi:hypothetical protein